MPGFYDPSTKHTKEQLIAEANRLSMLAKKNLKRAMVLKTHERRLRMVARLRAEN